MPYLIVCRCACGATDTVVLAVEEVDRVFTAWRADHTAPGCDPEATGTPHERRSWVERQLQAIEAELIARGVHV